MKRFIRVLLKLITLPFTVPFCVLLLMVGLLFVFGEWLNNDADGGAEKNHLYKLVGDFKNYLKNIFR